MKTLLCTAALHNTTISPLTVRLQFVSHLVDLSLQSGISGELVHHADGGVLLLHLLDLRPHLALLLSIFLDDPGELHTRWLSYRDDLTSTLMWRSCNLLNSREMAVFAPGLFQQRLASRPCQHDWRFHPETYYLAQ